jgi:hypothetical protein
MLIKLESTASKDLTTAKKIVFTLAALFAFAMVEPDFPVIKACESAIMVCFSNTRDATASNIEKNRVGSAADHHRTDSPDNADNKEQKNKRLQPGEKRLDHLPLEHHAQVGIHRFEFAVRKDHVRLPSGSIIE